MNNLNMNDLRKALRIGAILAMLTFVTAIPMDAQSNSTGMGSSTSSSTRTNDRDDDGMDWGWLGLVGVLGLAGLMPKKRVDTHRDDNRTGGH